MNDELTKEQWQAIAEKLKEYLTIACNAYPSIEECHNKCPIPCEFAITWLTQAKKELGYE